MHEYNVWWNVWLSKINYLKMEFKIFRAYEYGRICKDIGCRKIKMQNYGLIYFIACLDGIGMRKTWFLKKKRKQKNILYLLLSFIVNPCLMIFTIKYIHFFILIVIVQVRFSIQK